MQKTTLSTPPKSGSVKYFRYEMKDTNQLLKDLISCNMSDTWSRSAQNKQESYVQEIIRQSTNDRDRKNSDQVFTKNKIGIKKINEDELPIKQIQNPCQKYQDQLSNYESDMFKDIINDSNINQKRKKVNNPMEELILHKIFMDISDNQENQQNQKPSFQKYKNKDLEYNTNQNYDQSRQTKKQKKGLANISLRVKNIVSQHKKLSYKQVSDLVLQYSKDQIDQLSQSQKIREIKNIKRRVYDALNVLVAVGILGKHQRCVCITQWTNVPGKKLSPQWQKINNKIQYITKLKKSCADKSQALQLLIDKYNAIMALRNKHKQEEVYERSNEVVTLTQDKVKMKHQVQHKNLLTPDQNKKLMFPVIVFCPTFEDEQNDKLKVQMQYEETNNQEKIQEKRQKIKISGKDITILGDFDCALELNLEKYRDFQKQKELMLQIQRYGNDNVRKRFESYKNTTDHYEQNIEDYFNENMFESD